ncbi:MAG: AbrB family transcriptional regulator [Alphaproteobacteria bacterium]|nr:AbrB family transcriptional regulator [Alphaproteobacteria bacterium]
MAHPALRSLVPPVIALACGVAGGSIFFRLGLPLPWMMGAMVATTVAAVAGAPVALPHRLRTVMIVVLGVMLGSAFTPDVIERAGPWAVSLGLLVPFIVLATGASLIYHRRIAGYEPVTAYFASAPGGLTDMTIMGGALGGDERTIALTHSARIFLVVMLIPTAFRLFGGFDGAQRANPFVPLDAIDAAVLAACGVAGYLAANALRVPAGALVGPAVASAALHLPGVTDSALPGWSVAVAQIVVGTAIGCRFAGVAVRTVGRVLALALGSLMILVIIAGLITAFANALTGLDPRILVLAYAPGGMAEMALVALALGLDPALVTTHHVARIFLVVLLIPLAFRLARPRDRSP